MLFGHIYVDPSSTPHRTQSDHMSALLVHRVCANCTSHALHVYTNLRMKESFHDSRASAVKTKFKKLPIVRRIRRVPRNFRGKWNFTRLNTCELCTIWIRHVQHAPWSIASFTLQTVKWEAEETVDIQMHTAVLTSTSSMRIPVI